MGLKMGHVGLKSRSLGQILGKHCVRTRGHMFSSEFDQNVCFNQVSDEFENGLCGVNN